MMELSRRKLLVAAGAAAAAVPAAHAAQDPSLSDNVPKKWDRTVKLLIVGAGGAGLTAAVSAAQNGLTDTLILEKMAYIGGNTAISGGGMNAVDPARQKAQGIEDSIENHYEQTLKGGDYRANPALVKELVENAPLGSLGQDYIKVLVDQCKKYGIPIEKQARVVRIIRETPLKGKVLGVEYEKGGKLITVRATKAVVVAAGGFGANKKMRALHDPRLADLTTTNHPGATGDLLPLMVDVGADLTGMDFIQCNPGCPPGRTHRVPLHQGGRFIIVDRNGKRFIREDERRDVIRDAVLIQPKATAWGILDQTRFDMINQGQKDAAYKGLETGDAWKADTIEELAKKMGLPPAALKATVDEFNAGVKAGKDKLGKYQRNLFPIEKPPFWGAYVGMSVHHTMGGVVINTAAEVIDRRGEVIANLYAAGEVTGGIHGANRLGGNAIADCLTFGRLVGKEIAEKKA